MGRDLRRVRRRSRCAAWFTRPAGRAGALPAVVEYVGYGGGRGLPHERLDLGRRRLRAPAHGHPRPGQPVRLRRRHPRPRRHRPGGPRLRDAGHPSTPTTYYYRRVFTDAVRAVDAVRALPGVDPARVAVVGQQPGRRHRPRRRRAGAGPGRAMLRRAVPVRLRARRGAHRRATRTARSSATCRAPRRGGAGAATRCRTWTASHFARRGRRAPALFARGPARHDVPAVARSSPRYNHCGGADRTIARLPVQPPRGRRGGPHGPPAHWLAARLPRRAGGRPARAVRAASGPCRRPRGARSRRSRRRSAAGRTARRRCPRAARPSSRRSART